MMRQANRFPAGATRINRSKCSSNASAASIPWAASRGAQARRFDKRFVFHRTPLYFLQCSVPFELEITLKVLSSSNMDTKPVKGEYLEVLLRSPRTIFSTKDAALLWSEGRPQTVTSRLNKYVKAGKLHRVHRGLFAKDKNYNAFELATRVYTPAYISFETVLAKAGVIFQFYSQIFVASYLTRELVIGGQSYALKKIRDSILTNRAGIEAKENYFVASPERAFLDVVYLNKEYHFDNLGSINWDKVAEILSIYGGNKRMEAKIKKYRTAAQKGRT